MAQQVAIRSPLALYRHLLRTLACLPGDAYKHYKHRIRQVSAYASCMTHAHELTCM